MLPDRVSNPGPLTYESGALPIALCGPAEDHIHTDITTCNIEEPQQKYCLGMVRNSLLGGGGGGGGGLN